MLPKSEGEQAEEEGPLASTMQKETYPVLFSPESLLEGRHQTETEVTMCDGHLV